MTGYTVRDVARMLGLSAGLVRAYAREGILQPDRGERGEYRLSFQDVAVLRTAKGLIASSIRPQKVKRALRRLKQQLPSGQPLTAVQIVSDGKQITVRDGEAIWNPESGQTRFNFEAAERQRKAAAPAVQAVERAHLAGHTLSAVEWYELGCQLETNDPERALDAYYRALQLDPQHIVAHVNLGRLHHEAGRLDEAEEHYRRAAALRPDDGVAAFNLGVLLEDLGRGEGAVEAYQAALAADPGCADAHYNLGCLYERLGDRAGALRHLTLYRRITRSS